jgi:type 1 glutamine amidotransferase
MKKILLVSDGIFHPPLWGRITLHRLLRQMDGFTIEDVHSLEKIPADVKIFSALVLHYHHKRISPEALARLDDFVKNGGGILAIHSATASFKNSIPYFELLGGRFVGHGKVERIEVKNQESEIFRGIPNFSVRDELYLHELDDKIQIHFTTMVEGKDVPVVWTNVYGKGKVCYCVPGHTSGTMKNKHYQRVLQRGLEWVTE